jgi:hypothetical protein
MTVSSKRFHKVTSSTPSLVVKTALAASAPSLLDPLASYVIVVARAVGSPRGKPSAKATAAKGVDFIRECNFLSHFSIKRWHGG